MTGRTVLVVEDDPDIGEVMTLLLEDEGYGVELTASAAEALEWCFQNRPGVALVDVSLPGSLDGIALTKALKSHPEFKTPVVLVSARAHEDDVREGLEAGADSYLVKPFDPARLLTLVASLLPAADPAG